MPNYPYDDLGTPLDTTNLERLNNNYDQIQADIQSVSSASTQAVNALETDVNGKLLAQKNEYTGRLDVQKTIIDNLVVDGDSSPEAAQARVAVDGTDYPTLKDRLDAEYPVSSSRLFDRSIPSSKLSIALDSQRIKLQNLSDEVLQAMAGSTPINATPAPNSVTTEKIADEAVTTDKINSVLFDKVKTTEGWSLTKELEFLKSDYTYSRDVNFGIETFEPQGKSVLKVKQYENVKTTIRVPDPVTATITQGTNTFTLPTLYQKEKMDGELIYRKWRKYRFRELNFVYFTMDNSGANYRLHATISDTANIENNSSLVNVMDTSSYFTSNSVVESSSIGNTIYMSNTDATIRIKVSAADFQASGVANINDYINSLPDFDVYVALKAFVTTQHATSINVRPGVAVTSNTPITMSVYAENQGVALESNNFKRYETKIENPLSNAAYTNEYIQIQASFEKGECKNVNCIVVRDENGNVVPHQWEDDRTVNLVDDSNIGRHNDGSLKYGTVWIKDSIPVNASKTYYVDVYQKEVNTFSKNVTSSETTLGMELTTGNIKLKFDTARKLTLSNVVYNGVNKYGSSTDVLDLRYKDSASTFRRISTNGTLVSSLVRGNGVHFKELECVWTIDAKFKFVGRVRLFANEQLDFKFYAVALDNLADTVAYGVQMQIAYPITATRSFYDIGQLNSKITGIEWTENNKRMFVAPFYAQGDVPRDDDTQPKYPASNVVAISTDRAIVSTGWEYGVSDTRFAIAKDEVFGGRIVMDLKGFSDTANDETNRLFNQLVTRATKNPIILNEKSLLNELIDWTQHVDYNYVETYNPSRLFYPYMSKFILWKFKGIGSLADQIAYFKETINQYFGGGTQAGLINAYKTTTSAGYQISSRIIPMAKHFRDEAVRSGDTANQTYMETLLKAYAELSAQLVEQYGFTPLLYTTTEANSNSTASGLKALSMGLDLEPGNTRWQTAYNTNLAFLLTLRSAENILQETAAVKIQKGHYLHYAAYTLFDYLQSTHHTPTFKPLTYMKEATSPSGAMKEYEYCISASRRGLGHTNAYIIYGLTYERTPYSIEQAHRVLEHLVEQAKPNGGHVFPLEGLKLQNASSYQSSVAFEMQAYGETILMLAKRV